MAIESDHLPGNITYTDLCSYAKLGDIDGMIEAYKTYGDSIFSPQDHQGFSLIHFAAKGGYVDVLEYLL